MTRPAVTHMLPADGPPLFLPLGESGARSYRFKGGLVVNRSRFLSTLLVASVPAVSGCATGGGGGGGGSGDSDAYRESEYTRSAELFLTQAEMAGQLDKFQLALEAAMKEMANDPGNAVGYFQAARAQIGLEDYVAADTLLSKAVAMHPPYESEEKVYRETAWIAAFNAAVGMDDTNAVLELLQAAEMIFPGRRPEALRNMGVHYEALGRDDEAIAAFGAALEIIRGPRTAEMMEQDSVMAQSWLAQEAVLASSRAMLLSRQERYAEAADEYAAYLARFPGDVSALSQMAAQLAAGGNPDSAQAIYDGLLHGAGMGIRDYFNVGVGLYMAENYPRAAEAFRKVVDVSPQNRDALLNLTTALYQGEDWEACAPVGRRLLELDPYGANNHIMLARCLSETEQDLEAGGVIEQYEALDFLINSATLSPKAGGGGVVTAELTNRTLTPGTMITVLVHFSGADGAQVGTSSLRVAAPQMEETVEFTADYTSDEEIMGYYFLIVPPRS